MQRTPLTLRLLIFSFFFAFILPVISDYKVIAQDIIAAWHFPNNPDDALVDISNPQNTTRTMQLVGPNTLNFAQQGAGGPGDYCAWATGTVAGTGWDVASPYWTTEISTVGFATIFLDSKQRSSSTGPRDFKIQYKIGAGAWTDIPGGIVVCGDNFTTGVISNLPLPAACDNQPSVFLRWIVNSAIAQGGGAIGSGGTSRIDDVYIQSYSTDYFRSKQTGDWNLLSTWEQSPDNISWVPAYSLPTYRANTITIQTPHNVTITASVNVDQVEVNSGGTLTYSSGVLTINDGSGIDLIVNGSFHDGGTSNVTWLAASSWIIGSSGSLIRSRTGTSAANWQSRYSGGIPTIPPTANWINRFMDNGDPSIISIAGYYPNLIFENTYGGTWTPASFGSFTGNADYPRILGNLDIGGSGSFPVMFTTDNTHANPVTVDGNIRVRAGSTLRNHGTGFEIKGNLIVDGNLIYGASNNRIIRFAGTNPSFITGSGTFNIYELAIAKTGSNVSLTANLTVDQMLRLTSGFLNLNSKTITLSGAVSNISKSTGYILSDTPPSSGYGFVSWNLNTRTGAFEIPFGNTAGTPISILFSKNNTDIGYLSFATYPTAPNNTPLPTLVTHVRNNANVDNSANSVDRFWQINKSGPSGLLNYIRLTYAIAENAASGNTSMESQRWNPLNEGWEPGLPGQTTGVTAGISSWVHTLTVNNFGTYAIANKTIPLPVTLLSFMGQTYEDIVNLNWVTSTEKDNDYFNLMRSFDGINYSKIAKIKGNGNSTREITYSFKDADGWAGVAYYRLDQVDFDGAYSKGPVIAVRKHIKKGTDFIYQNTAGEFVWSSDLDFNSGVLQWIDINGKLISSEQKHTDTQTLSFNAPANLPKGIYFLRWLGNDLRTSKIIIRD